jgi:transcriptional regulator with GAF, ATPase, and Fis domain
MLKPDATLSPTHPEAIRKSEGALSHIFSANMAVTQDQVLRVAAQETTLLLTGETGTGKTRLARLIHELSPRRTKPFLVIDCGALAPSLIESEMFGHVRGAFTGADHDRPGKFAAAGQGTLLLDEVNSLPCALQSKLLRAVDERVFEPVGSETPQPLLARLIAASNRPLEQEVQGGGSGPTCTTGSTWSVSSCRRSGSGQMPSPPWPGSSWASSPPTGGPM